MYINNDVYVAKVKRNVPGKTYGKMLSEAKNLFITVIYINAYAIYDMHIKFERFFLRSQENVKFARWQ